jgi:hypothetical protein
MIINLAKSSAWPHGCEALKVGYERRCTVDPLHLIIAVNDALLRSIVGAN